MNIIGIDPGRNSGGIANILDGELIFIQPMPPLKELHEFLQAMCSTNGYVFVEKAQVFFKDGKQGAFSYGQHFGEIIGILTAIKAKYILVPPKAWQKVMFVGSETDLKPKQRSLVISDRLFPKQNFLASQRCKKPHMGMIEAALIAEYGRRTLTIGEMS